MKTVTKTNTMAILVNWDQLSEPCVYSTADYPRRCYVCGRVATPGSRNYHPSNRVDCDVTIRASVQLEADELVRVQVGSFDEICRVDELIRLDAQAHGPVTWTYGLRASAIIPRPQTADHGA